MSFESFLDHRATLQKGVVTGRTSVGSEIVEWTTVQENAPCFIRNAKSAGISFVLRLAVSEETTHFILSSLIAEVVSDMEARWRWVRDSETYVVSLVENPAGRDRYLRFHTRRL